MKKALFIIFILLIFAFSFQSFFFLLYVNESKKIASNTVTFRKEQNDASIKVLVIGDSTGVGVGARVPEESLAGRISLDAPQASIANLSLSGAQIEDVFGTLFNVREEQFDLIVLQVGANDALRYTSIERLGVLVDILLARAKKVGQEVVWLSSGNLGLAPIFPWPFDFFISLRAKQARDLFISKAEQFGVVYVDLFEKRKHDPLLRDVDRFYSPDLYHPSGDGYGIWYEVFKEELTKNGILFQ